MTHLVLSLFLIFEIADYNHVVLNKVHDIFHFKTPFRITFTYDTAIIDSFFYSEK